MSNRILEDATRHPHLFQWNGSVPTRQLTDWLDGSGMRVLDELLQFWKATGGGTFFGTEELLAPLRGSDTTDDIDSANRWHRGKGMPGGYLLFATGMMMSAVRLSDGMIVVLDADYREDGVYESLSVWYAATLRLEYADRYDLR